jgi:hypothetical protein
MSAGKPSAKGYVTGGKAIEANGPDSMICPAKMVSRVNEE